MSLPGVGMRSMLSTEHRNSSRFLNPFSSVQFLGGISHMALSIEQGGINYSKSNINTKYRIQNKDHFLKAGNN